MFATYHSCPFHRHFVQRLINSHIPTYVYTHTLRCCKLHNININILWYTTVLCNMSSPYKCIKSHATRLININNIELSFREIIIINITFYTIKIFFNYIFCIFKFIILTNIPNSACYFFRTLFDQPAKTNHREITLFGEQLLYPNTTKSTQSH